MSQHYVLSPEFTVEVRQLPYKAAKYHLLYGGSPILLPQKPFPFPHLDI